MELTPPPAFENTCSCCMGMISDHRLYKGCKLPFLKLFYSQTQFIYPNQTHYKQLRHNTTILSHKYITTHTTTNTYNMTRGEATKIKVHFKGAHEDFIVFVDDSEVYNQWMSDKSVPLAHFVSTFKVFCTGQ